MQKSEPYFPTDATIFYASITGRLFKQIKSEKAVEGFLPILIALTLGLSKLKKGNYDIVLANHSMTVYPIILNRIKGRRFYYVQAYEPGYYQMLPGVKNKIFSWLSKKSYLFKFKHIVNSKIYSGYKSIQETDCIYPGIDLEKFFCKPDYCRKPVKWTLGTIWRKEPTKGSKYIMEAYNRILSQYDDVELVLAFAGKEMADTDNRIKVVHPHGDEALAAYYRTLDVYFCGGTVQQGAVHYPVLESMASGVSLITTQYYPANNCNSYLIQPCRVEDIVNAFEKLRDNEELRRSKISAALEDVKEFDWNLIASRFIALIQKETKASSQVKPVQV